MSTCTMKLAAHGPPSVHKRLPAFRFVLRLNRRIWPNLMESNFREVYEGKKRTNTVLPKGVCTYDCRCGGTTDGSGDRDASRVDVGTPGIVSHTGSILMAQKAPVQAISTVRTGKETDSFTITFLTKQIFF